MNYGNEKLIKLDKFIKNLEKLEYYINNTCDKLTRDKLKIYYNFIFSLGKSICNTFYIEISYFKFINKNINFIKNLLNADIEYCLLNKNKIIIIVELIKSIEKCLYAKSNQFKII